MIEGIFVEGLLYGIMVLGVFITFRILDFPDLTVDGSFPLGAAVMAALITAGYNPWIALICSFIAGILAGCVTAAIHNYLKVPNLLSGILTMTMLWSINIRVMGDKANLNLIRKTTILSDVKNQLVALGIPSDMAMLLFFIIAAFAVKLLMDLFFHTDLGLTLGAMGNNQQMVVSTGVNPATLKFIGLGLSNGLVALSGAFAAQYQGFADVSLGQGVIVAGLASVMIGEFVLKSNKIFFLTLRVLLGSIIFRALMFLARFYGFDLGLKPNDQRLITGITIIILLIITLIRTDKGKMKTALDSLNLASGSGVSRESKEAKSKKSSEKGDEA